MSHERKPNPAPQRPYEVYGFTEQECLYWRVCQERFAAILEDDQTMIHQIQESSNNYGDFLFVTTSREGQAGRVSMVFYGLGFHEYRERWITGEWYWYQTNSTSDLLRQQVSKDEAAELLEQRLAVIQPKVDDRTQTDRGRLFELLADLTDEDGALAELQDLGDDWEHLLGRLDE